MRSRHPIAHAWRRCLRRALSLWSLTLALLVSPARADQTPIPEGLVVAGEPPAPLVAAVQITRPTVATAPLPAVVPEGISVMLPRVDGGVVLVPGRRVGGYGNVGFDALFNADRHQLKPVWGLSCGWEFFELPGYGGGGGFNLGLLGGLRSPSVFALVGAGVNLFTLGLEKGSGGGILSPRAGARIGFVMGAFQLGAVGQIQRRWQWGSEDLTMVTLGLVLGGAWESRDRT